MKLQLLTFLAASVTGVQSMEETSTVKQYLRGIADSNIASDVPLKEYVDTDMPDWWRSAGANFLRTLGASHSDGSGGASFDFDFASDKWKSTLDYLNDAGVSVVSLHTVYDAGLDPRVLQTYDPDSLWAGLAISDLQAVNPRFASSPDSGDAGDNLMSLISYAHNLGMKVVSWANLSYFWPGSAKWTQAAADIKDNRILGIPIPDESPARWFNWKEGTGCWCEERDDCPDEAEPNWLVNNSTLTRQYPTKGDGADGYLKWRWSGEAEACVETVWAGTPSADFGKPEWRYYVQNALTMFIDMGLDGFYLDAPDRYVEDGYQLEDRYLQGLPSRFADVVQYAQNHDGKQTTFLTEHYHGKGSVFSQWMSTNVGLWGWDGWYDGDQYDDLALPMAILNQDTAALDAWCTGVDNALFTCLYSSSGQNDDKSHSMYCPAAMQRVPMFSKGDDFSAKINALMASLALSVGYLTAVESITPYDPWTCWNDINNGKEKNTCVDSKVWNPQIEETYIGQYDTTPQMLSRLDLNQYSGPNIFATPDALRAWVVDSQNAAMFGVIKYEAFQSGKLSLFVANLDRDNEATVSFLNPDILYGLTWDSDIGFDQDYLTVDPLSMQVIAGSNSIGTWHEVTRDDGAGLFGHLNCYPGSGLPDDGMEYFYEVDGPQTVAGCMLFCIAEGSCSSVTIEWVDLWDYNANEISDGAGGRVSCWLHSEVVDAGACEVSPDPRSFGSDGGRQFQTFSY